MELFQADFWESEWNKAIETTEERSNHDKIEMWNKRAEKFDQNVSSSSGKERINESLNFLDQYQVLNEPLKILDLGCGSGHFTLEFARRGHTVYALDPAENMIDLLNKKLSQEDKEVAEKVIPLTEDWLELDINERGFHNKFDLVFASMSPGISDVNNLQKAIRASKNYCFISRFSGTRFRKSVAHLLKNYINLHEISHMDIIYPLNWLYASGYKPVLHYDSWRRQDPQEKEEAKKEIEQMVGMFLSLDEGITQDIDDYVEAHQENGYLTEEKGATVGMALFDVWGKCLKLR